MEYVKLGQINDSFGIDGTIKIYSSTQFGEKRYKAGNSVYFYNPQNKEYKEYKVISYRHSGLFDFVKFEGINTPEEVKELKGFEIVVEKNTRDLAKGEYFYSDLKNCRVISEQNEELGIVKEVEEFPAQITLRVKRNNKPDFFVPFIDEFIKEVNIDDKFIKIHVIGGLLWKLLY